jgi:hypothetical protein
MTVSAVGAALIAALSALGGGATTAEASIWVGQGHERSVDRRLSRQWQTDLPVRGLDHLTGHAQSRSLGIGILEGRFSSADDLSIPIGIAAAHAIWNQMIYIVDEAQSNAAHELDNLRRLRLLMTELVEHLGVARTGVGDNFEEELGRISEYLVQHKSGKSVN